MDGYQGQDQQQQQKKREMYAGLNSNCTQRGIQFEEARVKASDDDKTTDDKI